MSLGAEVRARLIAHTPLTALVGSRIYPQVIKQSDVLPAIAYTVVSDIPTNTLCGTGLALRNGRIQIDVVVRDLGGYDTAQTVADAVAAALLTDTARLRFLQLSRRDGYERDSAMHTVTFDFSVWRT